MPDKLEALYEGYLSEFRRRLPVQNNLFSALQKRYGADR